MDKVSILVAVYNTEQYLAQCLDSLLCQSHSDIEIICIDDASTDNSLSILHSYAATDSHIIVLQQDVNSGQSKARNLGLKHATGQYICMVDSDDTLAPDAIECIVRTFRQYPTTDCVLFDLMHWYPDNRLETYHYRTEQRVFTGSEALRYSIHWDIHGVYALRSHIHKNIPYDESTRYTADDITTKLHYFASREVRRCDGKYFYRQNLSSVSNAVSIRRFDVFIADLSLKRHLISLGCDKSILRLHERYRWHNLINYWYFFITHRQHFTATEQQEITNSFNHHASTIDNTLLPLSLKLRTLYIPFCGIRGMKLWAEHYCDIRNFIVHTILRKE